MEVRPRTIDYYCTTQGKTPYREWYQSLKDSKAKVAIASRLTRVERGLFGDHKALKDGVFELRIDVGPGYRVYFGIDGNTLVLLLVGGDKRSQNKDIQTAKTYWDDHLRRKEP